MRREGGKREEGSRGGLRALLHDNRAQNVVIGSILIFAILILLLGVFQATVIPSANEDVEVEHSQQVRGEMQDIRNNVLQSADTGQDTRQTVKIGVEYPQRLLFINPGPTSGSITTEGTAEPGVAIGFENVQATDAETRDYLDGDKKGFSTGAIVYQQEYNLYQSAPEGVVVEQSLAYSKFSDGTEFVTTGQQIVSGKEISLVAIDGDLSRSEVGQYTVDTEAVSASTTTVPVQDDGDAIRINISTRLSEETLIQDVFRSQIDDAGSAPAPGDTTCDDISPSNSDADRYINNCEFSDDPPGEFNNFTLIMEQGPTYTLELAKVGVGTDISQAKPTYLVDTEGEGADIPLTGRQRLGFEVRDEFNNGIGDQTLDIRIAPGDQSFGGDLVYKGVEQDNKTTVDVEPDGTVKGLYYQAPGTSDTSPRGVTIQAKFNSTSWSVDDDSQEYAEFSLQVVNGSRVDRNVPLFNPSEGVIINDAQLIDGNATYCDTQPCGVRLNFTKTDGGTATVDRVRYTFYNDDSSNAIGNIFPTVRMTESGVSKEYPLQGGFSTVPDGSFTVGGGNKTVILEFDAADDASTPEQKVQAGDWFVLEFEIDGQARSYFIVIEDDS